MKNEQVLKPKDLKPNPKPRSSYTSTTKTNITSIVNPHRSVINMQQRDRERLERKKNAEKRKRERQAKVEQEIEVKNHIR